MVIGDSTAPARFKQIRIQNLRPIIVCKRTNPGKLHWKRILSSTTQICDTKEKNQFSKEEFNSVQSFCEADNKVERFEIFVQIRVHSI